MAKPHPFFLVLGLWLTSLLPLAAAPALTASHKAAYQELLKLRVGAARAMLRPAQQQDGNEAANLLLANYADFLELCVVQDQRHLEQLLEAQEARLDALEKLPRKEWRDYALAEVHMQVAMCKLLFGNRLSAAWGFRKAYLQYSDNASRYPDFIPNRKNLGTLQVLIGSVPDQYKWFLNIIGLKGSISQGMANLQRATSKANPFYQEAQLLQAVLLHMTAQDKEEQALQQITAMAARQQDNLLYQFVAMHLLKKSKRGEAALQVYLRRPGGKAYLPFPYLHHMAGDLYLFRGNYQQSVQENRLFLEQHQGKHYLKSAHFKLHLAYALGNHKPQAMWHLQQVAQVGFDEAEEDKYAARYAERQEPLVKPLMQARLHSDGGYYHKALQELAQQQLNAATPQAVQAEYYYRKARIYHGLDSLRQALPLYQQSIALCQGTNLYFAPNAALQLGYIYQQLDNPKQAALYFKKALGYKGHEYKNSIDAKAKLALSAM
ncbi:DUF3808 domain-containing protein [Pontibacter actiniarum]|uniref:Uncharacterized protein n=1 Tax=Pontibacter actiniarum TaxID=323450 RepID=A0A1X9YPT1_9BACT|nr:DUF3808 domain-containing protein [Pontibacter actiniarum]ARS34906.1 hypothetical protein CA264_05325 [Pontibacter actiniarum]